MPEGDTIYRSARAMRRVLEGKVVTGFATGLAPLARVNDDTPLAGRVIEGVKARGKWLLVEFSGDLVLATHMLMSGSWHLYRAGEKWWRARSRMRVMLEVEGWQAVGFDVPVAEFHDARSLARHRGIAGLGVDVLAEEYSAAQGVAALERYKAAHPETEVGTVLLNQTVLAGLGNVYKSEVAFAAGVNPFRRMGSLSRMETERLAEFAERYLRANVGSAKEGKRRTTGRMHEDERLWVYRRAGLECRRCGAAILLKKQGVGARVTFWCPACQAG